MKPSLLDWYHILHMYFHRTMFQANRICVVASALSLAQGNGNPVENRVIGLRPIEQVNRGLRNSADSIENVGGGI